MSLTICLKNILKDNSNISDDYKSLYENKNETQLINDYNNINGQIFEQQKMDNHLNTSKNENNEDFAYPEKAFKQLDLDNNKFLDKYEIMKGFNFS